MRLAGRIHNTRFVPKALRGDPHEVLACILTGAELGLGPMTSLRMINVIDGRPAASAELMRALVNRAGHRLSVVEAKQDKVTLYGRRRDTGSEATVTWTVEDAKRAQLWGKGAWSTYPRSMLLARATSELCRQIFSDVIGGLYTPEETAVIEGGVWEPDQPPIDPVTGEITQGVSHDPGGVVTPGAGEVDASADASPALPLEADDGE
jgi:RecT family